MLPYQKQSCPVCHQQPACRNNVWMCWCGTCNYCHEGGIAAASDGRYHWFSNDGTIRMWTADQHVGPAKWIPYRYMFHCATGDEKSDGSRRRAPVSATQSPKPGERTRDSGNFRPKQKQAVARRRSSRGKRRSSDGSSRNLERRSARKKRPAGSNGRRKKGNIYLERLKTTPGWTLDQ